MIPEVAGFVGLGLGVGSCRERTVIKEIKKVPDKKEELGLEDMSLESATGGEFKEMSHNVTRLPPTGPRPCSDGPAY